MAQIVDKGFTEMTGRVYDSAGLSPTIQTMQGGNRQPKIAIDNLKTQLCNKLIQEGKVKEYDVIRHSYSSNRLKNGDKNMGRIENHEGLSPTLDTRCDCLGVCKNYRIRKLTPTECLRLMGVRDEYSKRITCSNAQKYKQAGNGIVVDVLMAIFKQML